jgi:hypothetical protein
VRKLTEVRETNGLRGATGVRRMKTMKESEVKRRKDFRG